MAECGHKAVLGKVKRVLGISDEAAHQAKYRSLVSVHDLREGWLPTRERQRRKFTVGARLKIQTHRTSSVSACTTAWSKVLA